MTSPTSLTTSVLVDHHGCLQLVPQQSLVLRLVLHQPVTQALTNTDLHRVTVTMVPNSLRAAASCCSCSCREVRCPLLELTMTISSTSLGRPERQLSALVKLQHLEERISEQDLPLVLDVGQLVDIHGADGGHDVAG